MSWTFALINNRLAELYFERRARKIRMEGHCYVKRSEFTTKKEQTEINTDIKKHILSYQKHRYKDIVGGRIFVIDKWTII